MHFGQIGIKSFYRGDPPRGSERAAAERLLRIGGKRIKARPSSEGWKYLLKVGELKRVSFKHSGSR